LHNGLQVQKLRSKDIGETNLSGWRERIEGHGTSEGLLREREYSCRWVRGVYLDRISTGSTERECVCMHMRGRGKSTRNGVFQKIGRKCEKFTIRPLSGGIYLPIGTVVATNDKEKKHTHTHRERECA
jgi:hypothetical protein